MPKGKFLNEIVARYHPERSEWELLNNLLFVRPSGDTLVVPKGLFTDLASTGNLPGFPQDGPWNQAAVGHDFLYCGRFVSRRMADIIFKEMLKAIPQVPKWKIPIMFWAVSLFGKRAWDRNNTNKVNNTRRMAGIRTTGGVKILWADGVLRFV